MFLLPHKTCTHRPAGLCPSCQAEYDEALRNDIEAWLAWQETINRWLDEIPKPTRKGDERYEG